LVEEEESSILRNAEEFFQEFYKMLSGIFKQFINLVVYLEPKTERVYQEFKERNKMALFEATSAMEKSEKLAQHNEELIRRWEQDLKNFHMEKLELMGEIKELEKENKLLLQKIIKNSKKKVKDTLESNAVSKNQSSPKLSKQPLRRPKNMKKQVKLSWLRETINELYHAKNQQDQKVRENWAKRLKDKSRERECLRFETMEQFMYSYLKMRYGLKGLIIEQVEQIISGIKRFKDTHVDVLLFGKILRNEVDEQYRLAQQNIRKSVKGRLIRLSYGESEGKVCV
jgi:hypothetical protein